jgi:hypothetical protein
VDEAEVALIEALIEGLVVEEVYIPRNTNF